MTCFEVRVDSAFFQREFLATCDPTVEEDRAYCDLPQATNHKPTKGRQLEPFNPDDGYWEYSVVATNKALGLRALWDFQSGRGVQEKTIDDDVSDSDDRD